MREKLIETIQSTVGCPKRLAGLIADAILDDGWIRLPCKVGDTVYAADKVRNAVLTGVVSAATTTNFFTTEEIKVQVYDKEVPLVFTNDTIGKTVFLTREEAEAALRKEDEGK